MGQFLRHIWTALHNTPQNKPLTLQLKPPQNFTLKRQLKLSQLKTQSETQIHRPANYPLTFLNNFYNRTNTVTNPIQVFGAEHATDKMTDSNFTFECDARDFYMIGQIAKRGYEMAAAQNVEIDFMICQMDLTACHCNGTPLKLLSFLMADAGDFANDFCGIGNNMNRKNGKLMNDFKPIFAVQ